MKKTITQILSLIAVLGVVCALVACGPSNDKDPIIISEGTQTTVSTRATVAVADDQLTLSYLLGWMSEDMAWSTIKDFTHTLVDDTNAVFEVADGYGKTCTLNVTFDAVADTMSKADLVYGETTVSILSNETLVIREILRAMNPDEKE